MSFYICGDTGWRAAPRWAPVDVLGATETTMQFLSYASPTRTVSAYYEGDGSSLFLGSQTANIGGISGILLSTASRRLQNAEGSEWWLVTVELQQE